MKPYKPSFVNRLMEAIKRFPIPYWLTYLVLFFFHVLALHILSWIDGWVPPYAINPILLLFPLWLWGPLAIMTYLDRSSLEALQGFSPLLDIDEETMNRLKYALTTMPARPVIISGIIWSLFYVIINYLTFNAFYVANQTGPFYTAVVIFLGILPFLISSAIYYHSIRQLILVHRVVRMVREFNLFQLDPVYSFSRLTAQTGIAWVILLSLTLLAFPLQFATLPVLAMLLSQVLLALAAFVLPLWIVHQRLVSAKRRLQAELNQRLETTLDRLHHCLDNNELEEVDQINTAIAGLSAEREVLTKFPTWPWRAGTLTGFLTAILLPVLLFLIQLALGNWLGG